MFFSSWVETLVRMTFLQDPMNISYGATSSAKWAPMVTSNVIPWCNDISKYIEESLFNSYEITLNIDIVLNS